MQPAASQLALELEPAQVLAQAQKQAQEQEPEPELEVAAVWQAPECVAAHWLRTPLLLVLRQTARHARVHGPAHAFSVMSSLR